MNLLVLDAFWILGGFLLVYAGYRGFKTPTGFAIRARMRKRILVRLAFYVILTYFFAGFLVQIRIPDTSHTHPPDLVSYLFSQVPQERSYSAPFADKVTGVPDADSDKAANLVKGIHLLGTDINGNDVLLMLIQGAGTALILGFGTGIVSFPIGIALGILAGYFGGWVDDLIQWLYTTIASIPWLLFVIAFLMVFGRGLFWIVVAIGITSWVELARLIRGETMKLKNLDYITAARATGISTLRILYRHLLPNILYLVIITFTLSTSSAVLAESVLTFIGIGVEPGTSSWGVMLVEAQRELTMRPSVWWIFASGSFLGIMPLVLSLNIFGDALRDVMDPRLRGEG